MEGYVTYPPSCEDRFPQPALEADVPGERAGPVGSLAPSQAPTSGTPAASIVCRRLGKYKLPRSRDLEIPLCPCSKNSLLGIVPCKGVLSLLNLLIPLSPHLPIPPRSHRFLGSPLSVLMQVYPAGTSSGPGTIGK